MQINMWLSKARLFKFPLRRFAIYYTKEHEWLNYNPDQKQGVLGITDHAQSQLGDVVHIDLPEMDSTFSTGDVIGVVESVKTVADIYSPVSGKIVEVNSGLPEEPETINSSPEDNGWICKISLDNPSELEGLMDKAGYDKFLEEEA